MARKRDGSQRELVFDCTQRDTILREMRLPRLVTEDGIAVRDITAQVVLYKINSHAGRGMAWPSIETLRRECGNVSERTIRRAINALAHAKILGVERKRLYYGERASGNHYCIDWQELLRYCRDCPAINRTFGRDQSDIPAVSNGHVLAGKAPTKAVTKPPPTPKRITNPWKAAAAAFQEAGIGSAQQLANELREADVDPAEAIDRCRRGKERLDSVPPGTFRRATGALVHFIRNGRWPVDGIDTIAARPERVDLEQYWPIVEAMSLEEQLAILPPGMARERLVDFGPTVPEVRWSLLNAYHVRTQAASA